MEDLTGKQFGPYRIVGPLGQGGMAAVYKAYDARMDRYVALKALPRYYASDPNFIGRFEQEAKVVASLQHPHILPVFDYGESDGFTFIVMPYIEGGTLTNLLQNKPLPFDHIQKVLSQMGEALDYAHSRGVVHRDIKPSNILVDERGNCLLTDFGIARIIEGNKNFTATGSMIGTPTYMSPEQGRGDLVDHRSDIYSLGVILYQMVTGQLPFDAETPAAVIVKHIINPLPLPSTVWPQVPEPVERVIMKSLAKNPADRYATAGEMVKALQAAIQASKPVARPRHTIPVETAGRPASPLPESPAGPTPSPQPAPVEAAPPPSSPGNARPAPQAKSDKTWQWLLVMGGLVGLCMCMLVAGVVAFPMLFNNNLVGDPTEDYFVLAAAAETDQPPAARPTGPLVEGDEPLNPITATPTRSPNATVQIGATATRASGMVTATSAAATPAPVAGPAEPVNISNNSGYSTTPVLFHDPAGTVHVAWIDNSEGNRNQVFYRQLLEGRNFSEVQSIVAGAAVIMQPLTNFYTPAGWPCLAWSGMMSTSTGSSGIFAMCLSESGWSEPVQLTQELALMDYSVAVGAQGNFAAVFVNLDLNVVANGLVISGNDGDSWEAEIAADSKGGLHVVWHWDPDDESQPSRLEYRYSSDGGQSWSDTQVISDESYEPDFAPAFRLMPDSLGNVHLVYKSDDTMTHKTWNPSAGWSLSGSRLRPRGIYFFIGDVAAVVNTDGQVSVSWYYSDLYLSTQDAGGSWSEAEEVLSFPSGSYLVPVVLVEGSDVFHFVWMKDEEIFYFAYTR